MKRKKEDRDRLEVEGYLTLSSLQHQQATQSAGQNNGGTAPTGKLTFAFTQVREKLATFETIRKGKGILELKIFPKIFLVSTFRLFHGSLQFLPSNFRK